jgi:hypothetical protein
LINGAEGARKSSGAPDLTIIITVVSGKDMVGRCLDALTPQVNFDEAEIIVPYDERAAGVGELSEDYPGVRFHFISDGEAALNDETDSLEHRFYDRRRAVGLALARAPLIAMTEDHAIPASDWCRRIIEAHRQPYAVIGGAIDNGADAALNWAIYYCDFGRYGRPFPGRLAEYASDVNISYKRSALEAIGDTWHSAYHETTVNWTLRSRGEEIFLDPSIVVYQHRPPITFAQAYRERIEWGRVFAETRVAACGRWQRVFYGACAPLLPVLLLSRVARHMIRQRRSIRQIAKTLPLAALLLTGWALGELSGYIAGRTDRQAAGCAINPEIEQAGKC